jgi:hypothetical protein
MTIQLTDHARSRLQQRGIPTPVLDCLLEYGRKVHDHRGGEVIFFDHQSRAQLRRDRGDAVFKQMETKLGTYAVLAGDGSIVTVGHRTKRINRH